VRKFENFFNRLPTKRARRGFPRAGDEADELGSWTRLATSIAGAWPQLDPPMRFMSSPIRVQHHGRHRGTMAKAPRMEYTRNRM
jgi:hypothetical protein